MLCICRSSVLICPVLWFRDTSEWSFRIRTEAFSMHIYRVLLKLRLKLYDFIKAIFQRLQPFYFFLMCEYLGKLLNFFANPHNSFTYFPVNLIFENFRFHLSIFIYLYMYVHIYVYLNLYIYILQFLLDSLCSGDCRQTSTHPTTGACAASSAGSSPPWRPPPWQTMGRFKSYPYLMNLPLLSLLQSLDIDNISV